MIQRSIVVALGAGALIALSWEHVIFPGALGANPPQGGQGGSVNTIIAGQPAHMGDIFKLSGQLGADEQELATLKSRLGADENTIAALEAKMATLQKEIQDGSKAQQDSLGTLRSEFTKHTHTYTVHSPDYVNQTILNCSSGFGGGCVSATSQNQIEVLQLGRGAGSDSTLSTSTPKF